MRKIFFFVGLLTVLCGQPVLAEEPVWCLVTEDGKAIAMSRVSCLVAADDETTFSVVLKDGTTLDGLQKAIFDQRVPMGIKGVTDDPIRVNRELSLEGVAPETPVRVYGTGGKLLRQSTAQLIELADLPSGIYIIQVNGTSFKVAKP